MSVASRSTKSIDRRARQLSADATGPRERTRRSAERLSLLAMRNWERALAGIVTVPAAAAITTGAVVLFGVAILEETFGLFDTALVGVGRGIGEGLDPRGPRQGGQGGPVTESAADAWSSGSRGPSSTTGVVAVARARPKAGASAGAPSGVESQGRPRSSHTAGGGGVSVRAAAAAVRDFARDPAPGEGRGRANAGAAPDEAKDAWDVVLVDVGANPIGLIRELRELTGMDLRDLETLVGSVPEAVKRAVPRAEADGLRDRIEAAGGRVEVRTAPALEAGQASEGS